MQLLVKARKDYTDKLGRTWHWNGTKYEYVRKGKQSAKPQAASPTSTATAWRQLEAAELDALKTETTLRGRIFVDQRVQEGNRTGMLVAVGDGGAPVIKYDGDGIHASMWRALKPIGSSVRSTYDGLVPQQVHHVTDRTVQSSINNALDKPIDGSHATLRQLLQAFKKKGFTPFIVGGAVRDLLQGKAAKDLDFVVSDVSDSEMKAIIRSVDPTLLAQAVTNEKLGLVSFSGYDFTPMHMWSEQLQSSEKGGTLLQDAQARDLTFNSLHIDPLRSPPTLIDGTGRGLTDMASRTLRLSAPQTLPKRPDVLLRVLKFVTRGYNLPVETAQLLKKHVATVSKLPYSRLQRFFTNQIVEKDGKAGMDKFRQAFMALDSRVWQASVAAPFEAAYRARS